MDDHVSGFISQSIRKQPDEVPRLLRVSLQQSVIRDCGFKRLKVEDTEENALFLVCLSLVKKVFGTVCVCVCVCVCVFP